MLGEMIVRMWGMRINRKCASLLKLCFEHPYDTYRERALNGLIAIRCIKALEYVCFNHPYDWFKEKALEALIKLGARRALENVALNHPCDSFRERALAALGARCEI